MVAEYHLYRYTPLQWVEIHFCVTFFILAVIQFFYLVYTYKKYSKAVQCARFRRYIYTMVPLLLGFLIECVGFVGRSVSSDNIDSVGAFVVQSTLLSLGPTFMNLSIFMAFKEIIVGINAERLYPIPKNYILLIYIYGEVSAVFLKMFGGVLSGYYQFKVGYGVLVTGALVDDVLITGFIITTLIFWANYNKNPTKVGLRLTQSKPFFGNWKHALVAIISASILLLVRLIYRSIRYINGYQSAISSKEVYFFTLDTAMVQTASYILLSINFSLLFSKIDSEYTSIYDHGDLESLASIS